MEGKIEFLLIGCEQVLGKIKDKQGYMVHKWTNGQTSDYLNVNFKWPLFEDF